MDIGSGEALKVAVPLVLKEITAAVRKAERVIDGAANAEQLNAANNYRLLLIKKVQEIVLDREDDYDWERFIFSASATLSSRVRDKAGQLDMSEAEKRELTPMLYILETLQCQMEGETVTSAQLGRTDRWCVYFVDEGPDPRLGRVYAETPGSCTVVTEESTDSLMILPSTSAYPFESFSEAVEHFCKAATHLDYNEQARRLHIAFPSKAVEIEAAILSYWDRPSGVSFG